jgi:(1->4)-alpha-D-glucan 1-alpha-D-glucosylmutase
MFGAPEERMSGTRARKTPSRRPPARRATYRLQMNLHFTFRDAERIVPYLDRLGVSHLYLSPILAARPGSLHGYDVVDHSKINPEIGTRADLEALAAALRKRRMGMIVDVVPNHMAVMGDDNAWWLDVLENGPAAAYAEYFDIDWQPVRASMRNRILVPVLGAPYGTVLEDGQLRLVYDDVCGAFSVRYHEHRFPIDPREYPRLFEARRDALDSLLPPEHPDRQDLESLLSGFSRLPAREEVTERARAERYRDKESHKRRLVRLCRRSTAVRQFIADSVAAVNGRRGDPRSFDVLDDVLGAQAYRLANWRVAVDEINYRRFFDVNNLAALRINDPRVFDETHALLLELVKDGIVDGLRIDHPDGLYDPEEYFDRLQAPFRVGSGQRRPLYVVAEKILAAHERLPDSWAVQGTTGYEFSAAVGSWLVDGAAERAMDAAYRGFIGRPAALDDIAYESRKLVMRSVLAAEVGVLATQLDRIAQGDRHTADFTRAALREAIVEVIASYPVYRTYVSASGAGDDDHRHVQWAVNVARKRSHADEDSVFKFLGGVLVGDAAGRPPAAARAVREFAMKFQQVTAPVMAKGIEDTAYYRYNRLAALNEVGGDPRRMGMTSAALHQMSLDRQRRWPRAMITTSTHDTKRSEDVRARISCLSEFPEAWRRYLGRWSRLNRGHRRQVDGAPAPTRNEEYLLYQTLLGAWPPGDAGHRPGRAFKERIESYMIKAAREAKQSTSWIAPNEAYEQAMSEFVRGILDERRPSAFLRDLQHLRSLVAWFGTLNSLSQTLLKLTAPGIPDLYQGTELPEFSLVDPDNRRPVDFEQRDAMLAALEAAWSDRNARAGLARELLQHWSDGRLKLFVTWRTLGVRAALADVFGKGKYQALRVSGTHAGHVCAFRRELDGREAMIVAPARMGRLTGGRLEPPLDTGVWGDTRINFPKSGRSHELVDAFASRTVRVDARRSATSMGVGELLDQMPIALLVSGVSESQRD